MVNRDNWLSRFTKRRRKPQRPPLYEAEWQRSVLRHPDIIFQKAFDNQRKSDVVTAGCVHHPTTFVLSHLAPEEGVSLLHVKPTAVSIAGVDNIFSAAY
ncbi:hypothetical protein RRF57_007993 [Xylaria bambusicola]|uniref:Uncharacterized protein n=1 Tax=Xylaria bambusicola TaxID=326684 RepID=A0AAN7UWA1_9PEZI